MEVRAKEHPESGSDVFRLSSGLAWVACSSLGQNSSLSPKSPVGSRRPGSVRLNLLGWAGCSVECGGEHPRPSSNSEVPRAAWPSHGSLLVQGALPLLTANVLDHLYYEISDPPWPHSKFFSKSQWWMTFPSVLQRKFTTSGKPHH